MKSSTNPNPDYMLRAPNACDEDDSIERENIAKLERLMNREDAAVLLHPLMEEGFGKFIAVNDVAIERYGYSREEFLNLTAKDITNPVDSVRHSMRSMRTLLHEKKHLVVRSEHIAKSGTIIPVEIDATVIPHNGNDLILAVIRDLEQREFEKSLLESEIRFRSFLEKSADPVFVGDVSGQFLDVNKAACDTMGYTRGELLNMKVDELDANLEQVDLEAQWEQIYSKEPLRLEALLRKKNGSLLPVELHISGFLDNGKKTLLSTVRDLSGRNEQERKLRESEYRFRALLESVDSLAVQGYRPDGTIFFWNKANEAIYGYTAEEALGKNLIDLIIPEEMKEPVRGFIEEAGKTGEMPEAGELCLKTKDGSGVWVYSSHVAIQIEDSYELYCLDLDLTAMKETERQKEKGLEDLVIAKDVAERANKAKDDFLAVMSHEMRTPLNPIVGFASLMLDDCREDQKEFLESILSSSSRLLNLIGDILDFSKIESGKKTLNVKAHNIIELFDTALVDVKELGSHLELKFENGFDELEKIPEQLVAEFDYDGLLRVIDNLLTNACKYTEVGSVTLQVGMRASQGNAPENLIVIQVSDTGVGISEHDLENLFEPFNQVDASYSRSGGGVGLGLAICREMVALMGGKISVDSQSGKGSQFRVELMLPCL